MPNNQEAPDSDDAVSIDNASVNLSSGTNIASLRLGHTTAATLTLSAAAANSNIASGEDIDVGSGSTLTLTCPGGGCFGGPGGAPSLNSATGISNAGTITVTANASGGGGFHGPVTNTGTININGSAIHTHNAGTSTFDNEGMIAIANGMTLSSGGDSCGDTSTSVIDDTGGQIIANGTGALAAVNYTQGDGTTGGTATYPVIQTCGYLHYTGSGASTILATYGFKLTGTSHSGQSLTIRADHFNTNADASASGFTNGGSLTLDCSGAGCAGGTGGAPTINVGANALTNSGTFTVTANASGSGGVSGNIANTGTIIFNGDARLLNAGTLSQTAGKTTIASGAHFDADGTMTVSGGTLSGAGTLTGSVSNTGGTVAPASSPGTLSITGNYTQSAGGTLQIAVNSTGADQFSVLTVGGSPTLGGTLALVPSADYAAAAATGDKVGFLTYTGSRSGTFATTTINPPLNHGRQITPDYTPPGRVDGIVSIPAPKFSHVGLFPRTFLAREGTTLKLTLSQPAVITGVVKKRGRKVRTLTFHGHAGRNSFKLRSGGLKPGSYRLTLVAVNAKHLASNSVTRGFTITKPPKT